MCVDGAWVPSTLEMLHKEFGPLCDLHTIPGAAREFAEGVTLFSTSLVDNIVHVSMGLHRVPTIVIVAHWNCGAYGGSDSFGFDNMLEMNTYCEHLDMARERLRKAIAGLLTNKLSDENTPFNIYENLAIYNGEAPEIRCFLMDEDDHGDAIEV